MFPSVLLSTVAAPLTLPEGVSSVTPDTPLGPDKRYSIGNLFPIFSVGMRESPTSRSGFGACVHDVNAGVVTFTAGHSSEQVVLAMLAWLSHGEKPDGACRRWRRRTGWLRNTSVPGGRLSLVYLLVGGGGAGGGVGGGKLRGRGAMRREMEQKEGGR